MVTAFIKTNRIASLDLIKLCAICGVLIIHLIGKTALGGVFWYAQAVPAFMVLMGYNCRKEINWTSFGKSYISYLFIYLVSLIIALYKGIGFSIYFLPVGFLPFSGPGAYWIILYFLFLLVSPLIYKLKQTVNASIFISLLFCIGWFFDIAWEQLGGVKIIYSSCPCRYLLCFGLGLLIKEKSPMWFIKTMWGFFALSAMYLYVRNYTTLEIPLIFFNNEGWNTGENSFAAFYPAMLVALALHLFRDIKYFVILSLGRFTYHVFLFQILWFAIIRKYIQDNISLLFLTFAACFAGGYIFSKTSNRLNIIIF